MGAAPKLSIKDKKSERRRFGAKNDGSGRFTGPFSGLRGIIFLILGNIAAFLPLCVFNGMRYSVDSPSILLYGKWVHLSAFIDSYRYFGALIAQLYSLTGHDPIQNCLPDSILFILLAGIGTALLVACIAERLKIERPFSVLALDLAVILSVENVWFCEILTFPESIFLSGVGLILCCFAIIFFVRRRSVPGLAASAVCLILATAVYQQYIIVFTVDIISVLGCEMLGEERPSAKTAFRKYAGAAAFVLGCGTVYILLGKAVAKAFHMNGGSRVTLLADDVLENIRFYLSHQHSFLKGRGYFRTEIMTAAILFVAVVWFLLLMRYVRKTKQVVTAGIVLLAFAAAYCSSYLPGVFSRSHDTRVVFGLFSVFFLFVCGIVSLGKNKWIAPAVSCVLAVVLAANVFTVVKKANAQKELNQADIAAADRIVQAIEAHEKSSGATVKNIFYHYDLGRENEREGSLFYYDFSILPTLTLRSGKYAPGGNAMVFELYEMPDEVYRQYFAGKDWHELDLTEQLVLIGDSAYLCVY